MLGWVGSSPSLIVLWINFNNAQTYDDFGWGLWTTNGYDNSKGDAYGGYIGSNDNYLHVVVTGNSNGDLKLYQNGTLVGSSTGANTTLMTRSHHYLGRSAWNNQNLRGNMKYFRVYQGHELTQNQITELYNRRIYGNCISSLLNIIVIPCSSSL